MSDLRLLASVYSEVRLADCLAELALTLLEEEAPALALLPVCDECLREGGLDCLTPVFCYGVTLLDEPCADELWVLRVETLLAWLEHVGQAVGESALRGGCEKER